MCLLKGSSTGSGEPRTSNELWMRILLLLSSLCLRACGAGAARYHRESLAECWRGYSQSPSYTSPCGCDRRMLSWILQVKVLSEEHRCSGKGGRCGLGAWPKTCQGEPPAMEVWDSREQGDIESIPSFYTFGLYRAMLVRVSSVVRIVVLDNGEPRRSCHYRTSLCNYAVA
jgi:hypothetical protein